MKRLNKKQIATLNRMQLNKAWVFSSIIKLWNEEAPHFNGGMPHRYDDGEKACAYCGRPKSWTPRNVFFNDDGTESK